MPWPNKRREKRAERTCYYGKVHAMKCKVPVKYLLISKVILSQKTHMGKNTNKHCPLADVLCFAYDWLHCLAVDAPLGMSQYTDQSSRAKLHDTMDEHTSAPEFPLQAHLIWESTLSSEHAQSHLHSHPAQMCQQVHLPGCNFHFIPCVLPCACQSIHIWTAHGALHSHVCHQTHTAGMLMCLSDTLQG